jgi:hydroxyacylglutathione hydrolase
LLLKRFYHEGLAQASYLIGCQRTGEAIVIDANRDPEPYIAAAAQNGLRITHLSETHIHADYLSGSRELAHRTGARLLLSAEGGEDWQYEFAASDGATLLRDGDRITIGNVWLDVVHTPGHTPEHIVFVVTDTPASPHPLGVVSGDFLFVGDVGRPDLLERAAHIEGTMRAGASQLFDSLQRFVRRYPDHLQIWPGHGAGSACGKALGAVPQSTLGYEKLANWALRITDREEFITEVLAGQPDPPAYFAAMKRLNRRGPAILGKAPAPPHLAPAALGRALASGARVVDLRPAATFAEGFIPGTISIPLNRAFVSYVGWLIDVDQEVFLLTGGSDDGNVRRAASELSMIGIDRISGWFGADTLADAASRNALDVYAHLKPAELAAAMAADNPQVVDVRALDEWNAGHIQGAMHIPLGRLERRLGELDPSRPVVATCQSGSRSAIASSLLKARGFREVANLQGGQVAWNAAGLPSTTDGLVDVHG